MYHVGYHTGHQPSSIRKSPVESATSITVEQETVSGAQVPQMGIDPGRHQPIQMTPSTHVKYPEAIITGQGGVTVPPATRCARRVAPGQPSPAVPSRTHQPGPPWGLRGAQRRVGYAPPRRLGSGGAAGPVIPVPASPSRRWLRDSPARCRVSGAAVAPTVAPAHGLVAHPPLECLRVLHAEAHSFQARERLEAHERVVHVP